MTLRVVNFSSISENLIRGTGPVAVIVAPNFEVRSKASCERLIKDFRAAGIASTRLHWFLLTLQGSHAPEILDAVKSVHTREVISRLRKAGYQETQITHATIPYPIMPDRFTSLVARLFRRFEDSMVLVVDYSALPRNLLSILLSQIRESGRPEAAFPKVQTVWLTYTWATNYPDSSGPEFVGSIVGQYSGLPLRELLQGKTHADIILVTGGSGHDAFEVLDVMREARLGNQIKIQLLNFISDENFHESHRKLRHHYGLVQEAKLIGADIRYVFSIRHALHFMRQTALSCASRRNSGSATLFAISPFGPKPLAVAANFVREEYLALLEERSFVEADVLNSSGTQYLSLYSLGAGASTAFQFVPHDLDLLDSALPSCG
jgi:hypothetical protein